MFRKHCARISGLFVAACISATIIIILNNSVAAHTQQTYPSPDSVIADTPSSIPLQTDTLTNTNSAALQLTEIVSTTPTLLDTIIEATAGNELAEEGLAEEGLAEEGLADDSLASDDSTNSGSAEAANTVNAESPATSATFTEPIDGTVFANRTSASVTFFVEGELYRLAPLRSLGITLRRNPAPLNMFNCDADASESEETCFWDPYLVETDGFYEVFNKSPEGSPFQLVLQTAGTPPSDRVWVQNRFGQRETLVFNDELYQLSPGTVQEFEVEEDSTVVIYRRSCITLDNRSVCEWLPQQIQTGFYYALSEKYPRPEGEENVPPLSTAELQPIVAQNATAQDSGTQDANTQEADAQEGNEVVAVAVEQPREMICQIQVDKLNVRTGPGLNYLVVTSVSLSDSTSGGRVPAIGRDANQQWIAVDQTIALDGWVNASNQLLVCDGDITTLPIIEITDGRLAPTAVPQPTAVPVQPTPIPPRPVVVAPQPPPQPQPQAPPTAVPEAAPEEPEEVAPEDVAIPSGQVRLVIQNVFDHEVRFTLSPDEYDLQPGETVSFLRGAGRFTFSVSSPWRGLSGNAELTLAPDQSFQMFLYFIPKPGKSDEWEMKYQ